MSEIKDRRLCLYGSEHSKCNRVMTLGFKELKQSTVYSVFVTHACTVNRNVHQTGV